MVLKTVWAEPTYQTVHLWAEPTYQTVHLWAEPMYQTVHICLLQAIYTE
jgi:hypothetical protein